MAGVWLLFAPLAVLLGVWRGWSIMKSVKEEPSRWRGMKPVTPGAQARWSVIAKWSPWICLPISAVGLVIFLVTP